MVKLIVMDLDFNSVSILDSFESLIWTERYIGYGDFELCSNIGTSIPKFFQPDYYLWFSDSEQVMIFEDFKIETDAENGNRFIITGRSLESILDRRIIWNQTVLSGNFQNGIEKLLNENAINPKDSKRKINNLIFEKSDDPVITELTVEAQFTGDSLYSAIKTLCEEKNIGFKIYLSDKNQFVFRLYSGIDRSYNQFSNPYVVFSPKFENIMSSNYIKSKKALKTVALVAGEGEGTTRKRANTSIASGAGDGLSRRELYVDARDISSEVDDTVLTDKQYQDLLIQRGKEKLAENIVTESFEGQAETTKMFRYGRDFFKGDIVQIVNEYGMESQSRITEFIRSISSSGIEAYPTFVTIDSNGKEEIL